MYTEQANGFSRLAVHTQALTHNQICCLTGSYHKCHMKSHSAAWMTCKEDFSSILNPQYLFIFRQLNMPRTTEIVTFVKIHIYI